MSRQCANKLSDAGEAPSRSASPATARRSSPRPSLKVVTSKTLTDSRRQFAMLVDSVIDYAIFTLDVNGVITSWNAGAERIKGYAASEIIGQHFSKFYSEEDCAAGLPMRCLNNAAVNGKHQAQGRRFRKDGTEFWADVVIQPIREESGILSGFAKITRDITEQRRSQERLRQLAHFDQLTGLPNRVNSLAKLQDMVNAGTIMTVIVADLVGLRPINDTFGRSAGDAILANAVERITGAIQADHWIGRLASDEFMVVLPGFIESSHLRSICNRIIASLDAPVVGDSRQAYLAINMGIANHPANGHCASQLMNNADLALNRAKLRGRNSYAIFKAEFREVLQRRLTCERSIEHALPNDEFVLFYQPQVRLRDRRITGAEALIRWQHPQRGLLQPGDFLDVLERSSHAHKVGNWVIREACAHAANVRAMGIKDYSVSVNLFDAQLRVGELAQDVRRALADARIPGSALHLELTENIILDQSEAILQELQKLRKLGVGLSFDDYGTGYASLSLLKRFPLSQLKIDRSFVKGLGADQKDTAIVRAVTYLARKFDLAVVAEGIETRAQHECLQRLGCELGQGFLFGKPIPGAQLVQALKGAVDRKRAGERQRLGFLN